MFGKYYSYERTENGSKVAEAEDPMPQEEGVDYYPIVYIDPDGDELAETDLPFDGLSIRFLGDAETLAILRDDECANLSEIMRDHYAHSKALYCRSAIYDLNDDYTGYDAVVRVIPLV